MKFIIIPNIVKYYNLELTLLPLSWSYLYSKETKGETN